MAGTPIIPGIPVIGTGPQSVGHPLQTGNNITLPPGTIVQGTVQGLNAAGQMVVQADNNLTLLLQTQFKLPKGAVVQLRIEPPLLSDQLPQFRILNVNGHPLPQEHNPAPATLQKLDAEVAKLIKEQVKPIGLLMEVIRTPSAPSHKPEAPLPEAGATRALGAVVGEGRPVEATLLKPLANLSAVTLLAQVAKQLGQPVGHASEWLVPGMKMQVRLLPKVIGVQMPLPVAPPQSVAPSVPEMKDTPLSGASGMPPHARMAYAHYMKQQAAFVPSPLGNPSVSAEAGAKLPLPPLPTPTPAGQGSFPLSPDALLPAASAGVSATSQSIALPQARVEQLLAQAQPLLPSPQIAAVVVGREANGNLLLATRLGMMSFPAPLDGAAQSGDVLSLEVMRLQRPDPARYEALMQQIASPLSLARTIGSTFTHLNALSDVLHGLQTSFAAQALQRIIPHIGSHLSAGMLLFMQLMKKGDVESWLGRDTVEMLERMGKGELVRSLGQEMQFLRNAFTGAEANQWQPVFLPIMVEKEIHTARLFARYEEDAEKKQGKGKGGGFHFVVEVELSVLGAMQFDGMVKVKESPKAFDLQLYTQQPLPDAMREEIQRIFFAAQEATGMVGGIHFRQVDVFPLNPMRELTEATPETPSGGIMA